MRYLFSDIPHCVLIEGWLSRQTFKVRHRYDRIFQEFLAFFELAQIRGLRLEHLTLWAFHCRGVDSSQEAEFRIGAVRSFFDFLLAPYLQFLGANLSYLIEPDRVFSPSALQQVLSGAGVDDLFWRECVMSRLIYGTGVSLESLVRLRWEQISAEPFKNLYYILVDGDRFPISFPLFLALRSNLRFAQSLHSCQNQWLFTSSEERQLNLATVSQNLYCYGKYLGLETLSDEQLIASRSQKILGEAFGDGVLFDLAGRVAS